MVKLFHFFGSIRFAILLIASTALFVILGTLLESYTESHKYAAYFTYQSPIFEGLLCGFFINILSSSLRRWPFRTRHIPFQITHLGLLMILAGAIIKNRYGIQGNMTIMEGASTNRVFLTDTYAIYIEKRNSNNPYETTHDICKVSPHDPITFPCFPELHVKLLNHTPHSYERYESWIKGKWGVISQHPPFPVYEESDLNDDSTIPISSHIALKKDQKPWQIIALHSNHIQETLQKVYLDGLTIQIIDNQTEQPIFKELLKNALRDGITTKQINAHPELDLDFSPILGFYHPSLKLKLKKEEINVSLTGPDNLLNRSSTSFLQGAPLSIDLEREPTLLLIQDLQNDVYVFALDAHGGISFDPFRQDNLNSFLVYDQGYGGYSVRTRLPSYSYSRSDKEQASLNQLDGLLRDNLAISSTLPPPLALLQKHCRKINVDFVNTCLSFLSHWDKSRTWLYPQNYPLPPNLKSIMESLDWNVLSEREQKGCYWSELLLSELELQMQLGNDLFKYLKERNWPLLHALQQYSTESQDPETTANLLTLIGQQVFMVSDQLPFPDELTSLLDSEKKARLLSSYLRAYKIHLNEMIQQHEETSADDLIELESPLTLRHTELPPQKKLENNHPKITLQFTKGNKKEIISLSYDRIGMNLKWPILNGEYLVRFQPLFIQIPHRIRLRNAKQINYPNSSQPYSFEASIIATDLEKNESIEKVISMNHVYETADGTRFYLSNISPGTENAVQHVQLVVNKDPAKYWLTYPGGFLVSMGIFLLFWLRPYKKL